MTESKYDPSFWMGHIYLTFKCSDDRNYGTELINPDSTFRPLAPHFCMGLIWVFSAISFQLINPQPSGLELALPFQSSLIVSPFLRGMQVVCPVRRTGLNPGFNGAYQRLPAAWTLSPISLI